MNKIVSLAILALAVSASAQTVLYDNGTAQDHYIRVSPHVTNPATAVNLGWISRPAHVTGLHFTALGARDATPSRGSYIIRNAQGEIVSQGTSPLQCSVDGYDVYTILGCDFLDVDFTVPRGYVTVQVYDVSEDDVDFEFRWAISNGLLRSLWSGEPNTQSGLAYRMSGAWE